MKITMWSSRALSLALAFSFAIALAGDSLASSIHHHTGSLIKYSQKLGHEIDPSIMDWHGENYPSDVDWKKSMISPTLEPNWMIADDFQDPFDLPVLTVRWWGSYFPDGQVQFRSPTGGPGDPVPVGPGMEDGYLISFFDDMAGPRFDPANPTTDYSRPRDLLGSYVIPFDKVRVEPTNYVGWDDHPIWKYEADLWAGHFEHPHPTDIARPDGFFQRPGERYWISIAAEVGHTIVEVPDPTGGGDSIWETVDTGKEALTHFWGWHTSPEARYDVATMSRLHMPNNQWIYGPEWQPIQPQHGLWDMAFELLTIPEPSTLLLGLFGLVSLGSISRVRP
ncbi:MAG: PEP-CTERM sorting domain-containing protein [Bythopirellula sp.]